MNLEQSLRLHRDTLRKSSKDATLPVRTAHGFLMRLAAAFNRASGRRKLASVLKRAAQHVER